MLPRGRVLSLTEPVAVVYHLPRVFTEQIGVWYIQRVEARYMMSSNLLFSSQHTLLVCESTTACAIVIENKLNKIRS